MTLRNSEDRIFSRDQCADILGRIVRNCSDLGTVHVNIAGWWNGELQWARNRVWVATDRRDLRVTIVRRIRNGKGIVVANQIDDTSLRAAVAAAERIALRTESWRSPEMLPDPPTLSSPTPTVWSDATYAVTADERDTLARSLMTGAEDAGLLSAGYLEMRAAVISALGPETGIPLWDDAQHNVSSLRAQSTLPLTYQTFTQAQCSMTVRHPKGRGSAWAGLSGYDWAAIDGAALAQRALQKCIASIDPVRIEPGRYTVVLEPQAVADLVATLFKTFLRYVAELGEGPWALGKDQELGLWRTKLGIKVVDERVTISHDPNDPELGIPVGIGATPITWIDHGVLRALEFVRSYGVQALNVSEGMGPPRLAFRMSGGTTALETMITSTERGLLITRLSSMRRLDERSLLHTGLTRDGMWLIERGKLTKAVQNMRFTESPLFVLNQIEDLGVPVPIFQPVHSPYIPELSPAIVPPLRARDFSFTSTIDAV